MSEATQLNGTATQETATPPPVATPPRTEGMDVLALAAKKEKAAFQLQRQMQEKEKGYQQRLKDMEEKLASYDTREKSWRDNPLNYLKDTGKTYQDVTEKVLADGELTPKEVEAKLRAEIEALKNGLSKDKEETEKTAAARAEREQAETVAAYKESLKDFVGSQKDSLKLTSAFDTDANLIYETIEAHFNQTAEKDEDGNILKPGKILSNKEAADMVEKYLVSELHKGMQAMGYAVPGEEKKEEESPATSLAGAQIPAKPQTKTLTNNLQGPASVLGVSAKTDSDRMARAMAAMEAVEKAKTQR